MKPEFEGFIVAVIISVLIGTIFSSSYATAVTYSSSSAVSTTYQPAPSFQTLYGSNVNTYWPILGNPADCRARQDIMLQVPPVGCQPAVVRSDLLAEQDVPVFCQIDALDINPLIDIKQIKNIQFRGQYPAEVSGVGFHPARAAIGSSSFGGYTSLSGSPTPNNIGYAVVVLKRQPEEAKLPDSVNVSLQVHLEYNAGNAYGIGRSDFVLEPVTQENWNSEKLKNSFWNGRYFVRLDSADQNYAEVSIYEGDSKIATARVQKGQTSSVFYVPGMYCQAGVSVAYDDYVATQKKAKIEVSSGSSYDSFDVYEGSNFYDGRCTVKSISINSDGETGKVTGSCASKQFVLELKTKGNQSYPSSIFVNGKAYPVEKVGLNYWIDLNNNTDSEIKGRYFFDGENLMKEGGDVPVINSTGVSGTVKPANRDFFAGLYSIIKDFAATGSGNNYPANSSMYYNSAVIDSYERVVNDYPNEGSGTYAKEALQKAIGLAKDFGDDNMMTQLINKYLGLYSGDVAAAAYQAELERIRKFDGSLSGEAIEFDNNVKVLRLASLSNPAKTPNADLTIQGKSTMLALGETKDLNDGDKKVGTVKLDSVDIDKAQVGVYCMKNNSALSSSKETHLLKITDSSVKLCGIDVRLDNTNVEKAAKIRLIPSASGAGTDTNLTVYVGIEKRAIQLTPDKVNEKIENLNKTIQKWQKVADSLGKVVTGLKAACFATATLLTFKNFMTGLSGEAIARQEVMGGENGWTQRCKELVPNSYPTMDACLLAKSSEIDGDVAKTTAAINKVNAKIQQIQGGETTSTDVFGKSVNTENVRKKLAQQIKTDYGTQTINLGDKTWKTADGKETNVVAVNDLLSDDNVNNGLISTEAMRSLMLNAELQKNSGLNAGELNNTNSKLADVAERVNGNMVVNWEFQKNKNDQKNGYPAAFEATPQNQQTRYAAVKPLTEQLRTDTGLTDPKITHISVVNVPPGLLQSKDVHDKSFGGGLYNLGLTGDPGTGTYSIAEVTKQGDADKTQIDPAVFAKTYNLGNVKSVDSNSYQNEIQKSDRYVRYYETEPYKGMPAIVPFDTKAGWYAATQQTLPAFGGVGAFDASGRVTSFWICNVGKNGKIQFDSGFGDDLCQQINLNTGQPLNAFPGLDSSKASSLIQQGQRAIMDAAKQYGNKYVSIGGERFEVGKPATGTPSTQCQDFMSPKDCHLMFNVCDPVVCPSSRCNFGGTYNVADVAQTGIIGSIFLCLPNIREGILIPVCLTGIHAGIEALISIMKNYRDCLQENLKTGQMVGICDEIYSIYLCEFFWNQVAPLINVLIPKLIEMAYGQGVRGGAEYLSVMSAWQNMQNSVNYFTQSYAVNSFEAFKARNIEEVGTEFCKAFISTKSPTSFDSLLEPDSPPQFYAWFDQHPFTTATVPATSQYKVFYHIFAGNDQGVTYYVYLRNPPSSGYYATNPTVSVASGFIAKGEYASQTKDFTAPEGYKELCVRINNDEECGFGQVSTDFAINYLKDSYVKSEASKVTVTSQKECVSGSNNPAALLNPNVQAGTEEFVNPELYNRGVVRICSSQNPGSNTDPGRFVDVGYCDDPKIRCWIDQRSIEEAITQGNVGTLNETLEVLDARAKALLDAQNATLEDSAAESALTLLKDRIVQLGSVDEALDLINQSNALFGKLFWNSNKAQLLIIRGDAQAWVARFYRNAQDETNRQTRVVDVGVTPSQNNVGENQAGTGEIGGYKDFTASTEKLEDSNPDLQKASCSERIDLPWSAVIDNAKKNYVIGLCKDDSLMADYNAKFSQLNDQCIFPGASGTGVLLNHPQRPYGYFVLEHSADSYLEDVAVQLRDYAEKEFPNNEEKQKEFIGTFVSAAVNYTSDAVCYNGCPDRSAHPYEVLYKKQGDCEDSAVLLAKLFYIYGYKAGILHWQSASSGHVNNAVACSECSSDGKEVAVQESGKTFYQFDATSLIGLNGPYPDISLTWKMGSKIVKESNLAKADPFVIWPKVEPYIVAKGRVVNYEVLPNGKNQMKLTIANYGLIEAKNVKYTVKDGNGAILGSGDLGEISVDEEREVVISEMKNAPAGTFLGVYVGADNFKEYMISGVKLGGAPSNFVEPSGQAQSGTLNLRMGGGLILDGREIVYDGDRSSGISLKGGEIFVSKFNNHGATSKVGKYLDNGGVAVYLKDIISLADDSSQSYKERFGIGGFYVYKRDYEILQKLNSGDYSYCGLGGKSCSGTGDANLKPAVCDFCGSGCSSQDCSALGKCYLSGGNCKTCSDVSACASYAADKGACEADLCKVSTSDGKCAFDQGAGKCIVGTSSGNGNENGGGNNANKILDLDERFKAVRDTSGSYAVYAIFYHLKESDPLVKTGLFVREGVSVISSGQLSNAAAMLDRPLNPNVNEAIVTSVTQDVSFGEGDEIVKLSEFSMFERESENTFKILIERTGQAGGPLQP